MLRPVWVVAFAVFLLLLGLSGLTGSSTLVGARLSRLSTPGERAALRELFGTSREIRGDEWSFELPATLSQQNARPPLPLVNVNQGLGQMQRNSYSIPVFDWGLAFRPLLWPLLFGEQTPNRWPLGVRWFLRSALLLLGLLAFFSQVAARSVPNPLYEQRRALGFAVTAAVAVFFSSSLTWWLSSPISEITLWATLCVAAAARARAEPSAGYFFGKRRFRLLLWTLTTFYLALCTFFVFYPPLWVPIGLLMAGWIWDAHLRAGTRWPVARQVWAPLSAIVCAALIALIYYLPYWLLIKDTEYPGQRIADAGAMPLQTLLAMVWPSANVYTPAAGPALLLVKDAPNVCEAAFFETPILWVTMPLLFVAGMRRSMARVFRLHPGSIIVWLLLAAWLLVPLPWLGALTMLRYSPWHRVVHVWGLSSAALSVALLVSLSGHLPKRLRAWQIGLGLLFIAGTLVLTCARIEVDLEDAALRGYVLPLVLTAVLLSAGLFTLHTSRGTVIWVWAWTGPLMVANFAVNPLVHARHSVAPSSGPTVLAELLSHTPGRVLSYEAFHYNEVVGHGIAALDGVQFAPDLDLIQFLRPELPREAGNRFGRLVFVIPPAPGGFGLQTVVVPLDPCDAKLRTLYVNHFVAPAQSRLPVQCAADLEARAAGEAQIWSRRSPVCPIGRLKTTDGTSIKSALAFDYSCSPATDATVVQVADGFDWQFQAARAHTHYAIAVNRSLVASVKCDAATTSLRDAHLIVKPHAGQPAHCQIRYIDSEAALRRLRLGL